jgi:tetratricopeptide (TPR) repeat protein
MLQVIREYAAEKLDGSPDGAVTRQRHADEVLALAEAAQPELRSSNLRAWQLRLRAAQENVRAALRWAIEGGDLVVGLRTAGALWDYWHYWADLREGARWLDDLLARPGASDAPAPVRLRALRGLAGLVYWQGQADRSFALYEEALALARSLADERTLAATLHDTAWAAIGRGDIELAIARASESAEHYRRAGDGDRAQLVATWASVAPVVMGLGGDVAGALAVIGEAVEINRRLGLDHEVADWLETRAMIFRAVGDLARANDAGRETLRVWHELGTLGRLPLALKILAAVELGLGRPERAVRLGAAADRWNDEVGGELPEIIAQLGDPVEEARPALSPADHARAVDEGRSMSLEEQIAYALEPGPQPRRTAP